MSGFIDHLLDPLSSGRKGRETIQYRDKLRALILDAPPVRRLASHDFPHLITALPATEKLLPTTELVVERVGETASAERFRDWKAINPLLPIFRLDPLETEEQVLETRAMGADAFMINAAWLDRPMLQYLVEVGRDYGLPAIISCQTAEDLAVALKVQDAAYLWLRDEVQNESLFDLEALRGRSILFEKRTPILIRPDWSVGVIQLFDEVPLPAYREKKEWIPEDLTAPDEGEELNEETQ